MRHSLFRRTDGVYLPTVFFCLPGIGFILSLDCGFGTSVIRTMDLINFVKHDKVQVIGDAKMDLNYNQPNSTSAGRVKG